MGLQKRRQTTRGTRKTRYLAISQRAINEQASTTIPTSRAKIVLWENIQVITKPPAAGRKKCQVIPAVGDFFAMSQYASGVKTLQ